MSQIDYIIKALHLQDNKIKVTKVCEEEITGLIFTVFYVEREIEPHSCPNCNKYNIVIKDSYYRRIKYLDSFGYSCIIKYKQKRFKCKDCGKTFNEKCYLAKKNSNVSNSTITKVLEECRTKQSFKDIARKNNISVPTTISYFTGHISQKRNKLTEVLCFDEFKATTNAGKYAFIIGDPIGGEIIDVVKTRTQNYLYQYFNEIPLEERKKVKYIVTDLFEPYRTVIKDKFWDSIHIADRFHWIKIASKSFNDLRVRVMKKYIELGKKEKNKYNKYSTYAYRLKKYWKFLLKNRYVMKHETYDIVRYNYTYKRDMSINDIIENLVNADKTIEEAYSLLLDLYWLSVNCTDENIADELSKWILKARSLENILPEFKEATTAYTNWFKEICNSFIINPLTGKRMTNGFIEGKNNYCKVIKKIAFGYKDFETFRARILYTNSKPFKPYKNK